MSDFTVDRANEAAVIVAALRQPRLAVTLQRRIRPDVFLDGQHVIVWQALHKVLVKDKRRADLASIARAISLFGGDQETVDYVRDLMNEGGRIGDWRENVDALLFDSLRWKLDRDLIPDLVDLVRSSDTSPAGLRAMARRLVEITSSRHGSNVIETIRVKQDFRRDLAERCENPGVFGLGHAGFDAGLGEGFKPKRTTILAGLSSAGKTAVALNWAMMLSLVGRRVAYCCYEIDHVAAMNIIISSHTGIDYARICTGGVSVEENQLILEAADVWADRIRFVDNPFLNPLTKGEKRTNQDNVNIILADVVDSGADVVFYDLFDRSYVSERPSDVKGALKAIQQGHKEIDVHGVMIHQINLKDVERRKNKRPTRDALEGIGVYVQICDQLFLLHRPGMWIPGYENQMFVICDKQKVGAWPWTSRWTWEGNIQRLSSPVLVTDEDDGDRPSSLAEIYT